MQQNTTTETNLVKHKCSSIYVHRVEARCWLAHRLLRSDSQEMQRRQPKVCVLPWHQCCIWH